MTSVGTNLADAGPTRAQWLGEAPFTLSLSAGYFAFFAHTGVLLALEEAGLRPRRIVGISAGALAGGLWCAGLGATEIRDRLLEIERRDFWDPGLPIGGLLAGRKFHRILDDILGEVRVHRIEDCPVPFAPVVFDLFSRRAQVPTEGDLNRSIRASCALPGLFRPVRMGRRWFVDGGVSDRFGLEALASEERILLHAIPSSRSWSSHRPGRPLPELNGGSQVVVTPGLPAVSPFALDRGPAAVARARDYWHQWLQRPVDSGVGGRAAAVATGP